MKGLRIAGIFGFTAVMAWLIAANPSARAVPVFGIWESSFTLMGLTLGIALTNVWRLHERLRRPALHFALAVILLGAGIVGLLVASFESPARTIAPAMMMIGLAWAIVAGAGSRLSKA